MSHQSILPRKFPGGLVVRIWCFHCHGPRLNTVRCMTQSQTKTLLSTQLGRTMPFWLFKYSARLEISLPAGVIRGGFGKI